MRQKRQGVQESTLDLQLDLTGDNSARLSIGKQSVELTRGVWSPILELSFKVGFFLSVRALTRVILTQVKPETQLYFLPLQLHPLHSPWPHATPRGFVKQMWRRGGPFLTLGWPQDTTGLEERCITAGQFLDLCQSIFDTRERILLDQLQHFREGLLASVFDSLDRIQHMFWRTRPDIVEKWYIELDRLVGRVEKRLADLGKSQTRIVIVSDHGFSDFDYQVHLNHWLAEHGYLVTKGETESRSLQDVDWSQSRAYAIGLNSVYLNLAGREGQGCVQSGQKEALLKQLQAELLAWRGPDNRPVLQQAWPQDAVFEGPYAAYGPDIVTGFSPGYRASSQTGLGEWAAVGIEANCERWSGDHCMAAQAVPGVLFANQNLSNFPQPSYRDIPALTIGADLNSNAAAPPPAYSDEDEKIVAERLKSLGYL